MARPLLPERANVVPARENLNTREDLNTKGVRKKGENKMLWAIIVVLLVLWLLGFAVFHAGALIHLILVVALVILVINLLTGRRTV